MKRFTHFRSLLTKLLFFLYISIIFNSCKNNPAAPPQEEDQGTGSIFITVTNNSGQIMKDVLIYTTPGLKAGYTDNEGTFSLSDVPTGVYDIAATRTDYGSAKGRANVENGKTVKITMQLWPGWFLSSSPIVKITSPISQSRFIPGDIIYFKASVSDNQTSPESLRVRWYSDKDGFLNSDKASSKGEVSFQTKNLSRNVHLIRLEVEDSDKNISKDSVVINNNNPYPVRLNSLQKNYSSISLNWSRSDDPDFRSYKVFRSEKASAAYLVYETLDASAVQYEDKNIVFGTDYSYFIRMELTDGRYSNSNTQYGNLSDGIDVSVQIEKMVVDIKRNYLYAIDRINNNLVFINLTTQKSEKTIYIGKSPTDLDIDATGDTLYVANYGSTEISIVDLNSKTKVKSLFVNSPPYEVECGVRGRIVYAQGDQWCKLILINSDSGEQLATTSGYFYRPDIEMSPDRKSIYAGESDISIGKVCRLDISDSKFIGADTAWRYEYGYSIRNLILSNNGKYIFYAGYKILASNLDSQLGNFGDNIMAVISSGSLAFGETKIFNAENFSAIRQMPVSSRVMALAPDDSRLYIYDYRTGKIYLYDVTRN